VSRRTPAGLCLAALLAVGAGFGWSSLRGRPWRIELHFHRVLARFLLESPMLLSQLRILEPWGLDFHSDDLDDFSVEKTRRRAAWLREELRILRSYERSALSPEQRRSQEVVAWFLEVLAQGEPYLLHDYPINQLEGVQSTLPDFLINVHQVNDSRDARNYVARLRRVERALDQTLDGVRQRRDAGVVPPRFVLARVRAEVESFLAPLPEEHTLVRHLDRELAELDSVSAEERSALGAEAQAALAERVYPAYRRLLALLTELDAVATDEDGIWKLPDGRGYYAWLLRLHTTTDKGPDEIHGLGLDETARIQAEIRAILEDEGIDAGDLAAALRRLHADPRFLYSDDDAGRDAILADYQAIIEEAQGRLPGYFARLPRAPVEVRRVPPFKENGAPGAYYRPAPLDGSRPGVFYANLRNVAETVRFGMRTLAYHEAVPGHHLQIALALENPALPLIRRLLPFGAFSEGWALYAERLAAEQGFHPTPLDHVGQLVAELIRAVRLVVDTGIHARRWTRERAIDYMQRNTGMPESDVVAEIERYIVMPGQACAYKTGEQEILRLRRRARAALGDGFVLPAFHEAVLGGGGMPLLILAEAVEEWLLAQD
jgi:uncharacterized protein (DUF885 family)